MTTIDFTYNEQTKKWEAYYDGKDGALHVERKPVGRFYVYIDVTGDRYLMAEGGEIAASEFDRYLDMAFVKKAKLVSDSEVTKCVINTTI